MPRPPILAYAEPELISSVIDNTSVHSNIDKLLLENNLLKKFKIWFCDLGFLPCTELHIHAILQQIYP